MLTPLYSVPMSADDPLLGRELHGFRIQSKIGSGATGVVYRATKDERTFAVKVLNEALGHITTLRRRFEREARALGRLEHPHVVKIEDYGVVDDIVFIVMEYLEGETLEDVLRRQALAPERALDVMRDILAAVAYAHQHEIVHRDLKPANVFLVNNGNGDHETVKILDFGLAKFLSVDEIHKEGTLTRRGRVVGTPAYMAPEQITGISLDKRADVYSAGVLLYELLADRRPFGYERRSQLLRAHLFEPIPTFAESCPGLEVDERLERVVRRALSKDPADRYPDAGAFLTALEGFDGDAVTYEVRDSGLRKRKVAGTSSVVIPPSERHALTSSDDVQVLPRRDLRRGSDAPTEVERPPRAEPLSSSIPPAGRDSTAGFAAVDDERSPMVTALVWVLGLLCLGAVGLVAWYATTLR